jgi:hypothetical protein
MSSSSHLAAVTHVSEHIRITLTMAASSHLLLLLRPHVQRLSEAAGLTLGLEKAENVVLTDCKENNHISLPVRCSNIVCDP